MAKTVQLREKDSNQRYPSSHLKAPARWPRRANNVYFHHRQPAAKDFVVDASTLLIAIACFFLGLALGALLLRTLSPQQKKQRELEASLQRAEDNHRLYQHDVTDHFVKSAAMLKELSQNYRALGEQLADSATRLSTPEVSRQVLEAASPAAATGVLPHTWSNLPAEPPKDYAPRTRGVLSEHFGLDEPGDNPFGAGHGRRSASATDDDSDDNRDGDDPTLRVG